MHRARGLPEWDSVNREEQDLKIEPYGLTLGGGQKEDGKLRSAKKIEKGTTPRKRKNKKVTLS